MKASRIGQISRSEIIEQLRGILEPWVSDLDLIDGIGEETSLITDLGLDSIGILQLILGLEQEFGVSIKSHELDSQLLSLISNLVNIIQEKLNEDN
jgi:acyl carrier protein